MEITTVSQFVRAVSEMRKAQKKSARTFLDADKSEAAALERVVDKALTVREKRLFDEENTAQGRLFQ